VADDWDDMSVEDKLEALRSAVSTLERRQDELLRHLSELADAVAAIELKLRQ
jgi:predicted  nucleic acid-binding Zn-ribbon protein